MVGLFPALVTLSLTVATMSWRCVWLGLLALSVASITEVEARLGKDQILDR